MGCSSCGKSTTSKSKARSSHTPIHNGNRRVLSNNGNGSPYGNPKVRMSFSSRNR